MCVDTLGRLLARHGVPRIGERAATHGRSAMELAMSAPVRSGRYPFERQLGNVASDATRSLTA
jgi:hypothetical protein